MLAAHADMPEHAHATLAFGQSGIAPLTLCVLSPTAHSACNDSAAVNQSAGDATGYRSSGGASRAICFMLHKNAALVAGCRVVELGCGSAAAGLFSARHSRDVCLTDGDSASLLLARCSLAANRDVKANVRFASLAWGEAGCRAAAPLPGTLADVLFSGGGPDAAPLLILCSDLLYYAGGTRALVETIGELVRDGGLCVCAFNPRHADWQDVLCNAADAHGLEVWQLPLDSCVPPESMAEGWFASTRLMLLWHRSMQPPTLAGGDTARLRRVTATTAVKVGAGWEWASLPMGSCDSDST
jgi:SAM-dependent methyltransferase